ncbi:MAG: hypothetical protein COA45_09550 [Zetaproteobacteria bacterium]|nr:MAG: hypothetical protein COA45_09550 [Zetaproteobacteria bacterium]
MSDVTNGKYLASYIEDAFRRNKPDNAQMKIKREAFMLSPMITIEFAKKSHSFSFGNTPFNSENANSFINDKWALYESTHDAFPFPYTEAIEKESVQKHDDIQQNILRQISDDQHPFTFPLILKPNSGSLSRNVFLVHDDNALLEAIKTIRTESDQGGKLLVQQYIGSPDTPDREIRALCLDGECMITYERVTSQNIPADKITNPSLWPDVQRIGVLDPQILEQINKIAQYLHEHHDVNYVGLDLKCTQDGKIWLIEGNSSPMGFQDIENEMENGKQLIHSLTNSMLERIITDNTSEAPTFI